MKAAVIDRYGAAYSFKTREMPEPDIKSGEILVRVKASSVNPVDWKIRKGKLKMVTGTDFPKILGADFSGEVVETGSEVREYKKGDAVFGMVSAAKGGAYAEYLKVKPHQLARKPEKLSFAEAAAMPLAGLTALQGLRDHGNLVPKQKVLINGALGGVGSFAVQIVKAMRAEVTGVCSTNNLQLVNNLGALHVIDYTREEVLKPENKYHLIFDTHGNLSFTDGKKCLYDDGIMVTTVHSPKSVFQLALSKFMKNKEMKTFLLRPSKEDLEELTRLVEEDKLHPHIDRTYTLNELSEAHEHSESGHARGKILIQM